jgi:DNA-binding CsgD family transcriptional regulator
MRVARPSLAEPFLALVAQVRPGGPWPIDAGPAVILFVTDPERPPAPEHDRLMQIYGLTATEAKVALSIAAGNDAPGTAHQLRVSTNTVHTHLRGIFRKLGINRQADLVRVLMRAASIAEPDR